MTLRKQSMPQVVVLILLILASLIDATQAQTTKSKTGSNSGGGEIKPLAKVKGGGTVGKIPRWDGSSNLTDSVLSENASNIGIGTSTPRSKLTVVGTIESSTGGFRFPDGTIQTTAAQGATGGIVLPFRSSISSTDSAFQITNSNALDLSPSGAAIAGINTSNKVFGVGIQGTGGTGVLGQTNMVNGFAVVGLSPQRGVGVQGESVSGVGVVGRSQDGDGVVGVSVTQFTGIAGRFFGNVQINGVLSKAGGSFQIDHPLDPANKYLYHSFVESPDMMNIYNGNSVLDGNGEAEVELPEWFEALNKDFRYQLTSSGGPGPNLYVARKVSHNRFKIAGGNPGLEVSWQITGIRQDAWANANRIPVEEVKPEKERGSYLYPELFGQPREKSFEWVRFPELMRQRDTKENRLSNQNQ